MKSNIKPFFLCVVDSDQRSFSIEGPMVNDERWNQAVCRAQSLGRAVRCFSVSSGVDRVAIAQSYAAQTSFEEREPGSIVALHYELD